MNIVFFSEINKDMGLRYKYRAEEIGKTLSNVEYTKEDIIMNDWDVLVIDSINRKKGMIDRARQSDTRVVLIDGHADDIELADLSVSAAYNANAQYIGSKYIVVPEHKSWNWNRYRPYTKSKIIFVSIDDTELTANILNILDELEINAIITNTNISRDNFSRIEIFDEEDYYHAMHECILAITDGGMSFLQTLHYGMPTIAIEKNKYHSANIGLLKHCCLESKLNKNEIKDKISCIMNNEYFRKSLSLLSTHFVDGKGAERIRKLIKELL